MPLAFTTTLAAETGHNTSANAAYNKENFAANFSGTTWIDNVGTTLAVDSAKFDDSLNPITPCHVSPVSVKTLVPNYAGKWYAHIVPWFRLGGGGGHIDVGLNNDSVGWVTSSITDMKARGFDGVIIDWKFGAYQDLVTLLIQTYLAANPGFTYILMIDNGSYVDTASLEAQLAYIQSTYFGTASYGTQGGLPILMFFGTVGGVDYAASKASMGANPGYWIMQGAPQLANAWADGVFDWVTPYASGVVPADPYNATHTNGFLTTVNPSAKGSMCVMYPGFNGYLTADVAWSKGKYIQRDSGKCWVSQASTINANVPPNCIGIQVATWNDWEEGSEIESAIQNSVSISASIAGNLISWAITGGTGDESTLSSYKVIATKDGVSAAIVASFPTGIHSFDLSTIGWDGATYSLYVVAVGKAAIRNQISALVVYVSPVNSGSGSGTGSGTGGSTPPNIARGWLRGPIVDDKGFAVPEFARYLTQELMPKTDFTLNQQGQVTSSTKVSGRTEALGVTLQNVTSQGKVAPTGVGFVVDNIPDGAVYAKIKGSELGSGFISQVNSTSTDTSATSILSQAGTTSIVNVASFIQRYGRGTVVYNAGTVDAGSNIADGYVYLSDPLYEGGSKPYIFTTVYSDVFSAAGNLLIGKITLTAGGGGSGGGGGGSNVNPCFAGNVRLRGGIAIGEMKDGQFIYTRHRVLGAKVRVRQYAGPMLDMGNGELVTPGHHFVCGDIELEARQIWTAKVEYAGPVYNLEVETDKDEDRNYFLDNGMLSHNMRYSGC